MLYPFLVKKTKTECVIEGLELCLRNNNSIFSKDNLLQLNGTGASNSCSYADIAVLSIDNVVFEKNVKNLLRNALLWKI